MLWIKFEEQDHESQRIRTLRPEREPGIAGRRGEQRGHRRALHYGGLGQRMHGRILQIAGQKGTTLHDGAPVQGQLRVSWRPVFDKAKFTNRGNYCRWSSSVSRCELVLITPILW